ncbi:MAG TPA: arylsulfatase [Saprospiraceae bacterium]|nr:arylsulfatase [Saprospiraceae bacterium]
MKPLLSLTICFLLLGCQGPKAGNEGPNIIVVMTDDLGYGDISLFYESNRIPTPNIDRIGQEGLYFTDAHTPSAVCTPTRYGLLTGRYNWRSRLKNGVLTGKSKALIPPDRSTLGSILQKQGYHTAFIGKWHLGWDWAKKTAPDTTGSGWDAGDFAFIDFAQPIQNGPETLGFDYSYGHSGSLDMAPYIYVENGHPTAIPDTSTVNTGKYSWWREGPTAPDFVHEDVTPNFFRRSIDYVKQRANEEKPFFLYLALPSPHTPILPTEEWRDKSGLNPYGDFMLMIDDYMGQLLRTLDEHALRENTLIIFTSDNGCSPAAKIDELEAAGHKPNGDWRGHKADIFEGGHRVPFLMRWPQKIEAGQRSDQTICLTDLMATFAELNDYELKDNEGEDSYSLLPILENADSAPIREATVHHSINGSFAIRQGDWKLILCPGSGGWSFPRPNNTAALDSLPPVQLYHLASDPAESSNLALEQPEKVNTLTTLLSQYIAQGRSTPGTPQENDPIDFEWKQIAFTKK